MIHEVLNTIDSYPDEISRVLFRLRELILQVAMDEGYGEVEESLKWGEPSCRVKGGSPFRYDWKEKTPDKYYLFFNCQTKLIETFRLLYGNELEFQGNRGIVLSIEKELPVKAIRHCLIMAMTYKKIKDLPMLGQL